MKIVNNSFNEGGIKIRCVEGGTVVHFDKVFNRSYSSDELFVKIIIPNCYQNDEQQNHCKIAVVNLKNGIMSLVDKDRTVTKMKAELYVDGPV